VETILLDRKADVVPDWRERYQNLSLNPCKTLQKNKFLGVFKEKIADEEKIVANNIYPAKIRADLGNI